MSDKQHYPKWLYSSERSLMVANEDEHAALEGDWYESPADIPKEGKSKEPTYDREALLAAAAEKGLKVDKRWSDARLASEVEQA